MTRRPQRTGEEFPVTALVPARRIGSRRRSDGRLELLAPRFRGRWLGWLQARLPAERAHERVVLDELGATVWDLLDGTRDIGGVCDGLASALPPEEHEGLVARTWAYLQQMAAEGWIDLRAP